MIRHVRRLASHTGRVTRELVYVLEDDLHAEVLGEFPTRAAAIDAARQRVALAWDSPENQAPCMSWRGCGRYVDLIVLDRSEQLPLGVVTREQLFEIDANGARWLAKDPL